MIRLVRTLHLLALGGAPRPLVRNSEDAAGVDVGEGGGREGRALPQILSNFVNTEVQSPY